ncbi:MAG: 6-carboxytetrahydropterin synthase QueD [Desulfobacteraceae bacterium]|jgi:6-pyruvoyltetrahydropterin/6-carboxytetrahydropterin synthase
MFELKIVTHFAAAHQLTMVAKKCENLHGHNWKVEVCVGGDKLNKAGVLIDFGILKSHVREITQLIDHRFLNELDLFDNGIPSSENIAVFIAEALEKKLSDSGVRVTRVTTWESEDACATYSPPVRT